MTKVGSLGALVSFGLLLAGCTPKGRVLASYDLDGDDRARVFRPKLRPPSAWPAQREHRVVAADALPGAPAVEYSWWTAEDTGARVTVTWTAESTVSQPSWRTMHVSFVGQEKRGDADHPDVVLVSTLSVEGPGFLVHLFPRRLFRVELHADGRADVIMT